MAAAFGWGALAASSLVIGAVVALLFRIKLPAIGLIMGFGAGVLISAVAFDLIEEAADMITTNGAVIAGAFAGCGVFFGGDLLSIVSEEAIARMRPAIRRAVPRSASCSDLCSTECPSRW